MKNFLALMLCCLWSFILSAQTSDPNIGLTIDGSFHNKTDPPLHLKMGDVLKIQTDSVYLMNAARFRYYVKLEDLRDLIDSGKEDSIVAAMITQYEQAIDSCKTYYKLLLRNADKTSSVSEQLAAETKRVTDASITTLTKADNSLISAKQNLDEAKNHLTEAQKLIKKSMRAQIFQKILIGVACLAIGYAVGN
jgi:hypothetical protein